MTTRGFVRFCSAVLKQPYLVMLHAVRVARDPHARLAAVWFLYLVGLLLAIVYIYTRSAGVRMDLRGCAEQFSEFRLAILYTLSPLLVVIMLVTLGESVRWLDARRKNRHYSTRLFWINGFFGSLLAILLAIIARC